MALLSRIFRAAISNPFLRVKRSSRIKFVNSAYTLDTSDDSDDMTKALGPIPGDPSNPPRGLKTDWIDIPTDDVLELAGIEKPRTPQPAYMCYPVGTQTWHIFNAEALPLGRMATKIAYYLQGKNQPIYNHSHITDKSVGNFVVVVNGKNPMVLGPKGRSKLYRSHSRYPGHLKEMTIGQVLERHHWRRVVNQAVRGMLPSNNVRPHYMQRLFIYPDLYHDFDFLPQFVLRKAPDINEVYNFQSFISDPSAKIIYTTDPNKLPEEIKHLKYEPENFDKEVNYRDIFPKEYTMKEKRKIKNYLRKLRRYRIFNHRTGRFEMI
ncbi:unnamed protein product [Blepharisma stoltei]|uniref:Mitochondrial ribosomal protein L13 n=1 Tax=Blepharisma stoltei TaxID=1481888 RepID=A0AAU9KCH4_9CILI|nr:unnamed protein product [Blepharisma stoltei]